MSDAPLVRTIRCDGCGASLAATSDDPHVVCGFCGRARDLPDIAFDRRKQAVRMRGLVQRDARQALDRLRKDALRPGLAGWSLVFGVGVVEALMLCVGLGSGLAALDPGPVGNLVAFGVVGVLYLATVAAMVGAQVYLTRTAPQRADVVLAALLARVACEPLRTRCPSCATPVQVAPHVCELTCLSCSATLLVADGMLVQRLESEREQQRAWRAAAARVWRAAARKQTLGMKVGLGLAVGGPFVFFVGLVVLQWVVTALAG